MSKCAYLPNVPPKIVSGFKAPEIRYFRSAQRAFGVLAGDLMLRAKAPDLIHETYFFPYRLGPKRACRVITIHDLIQEKLPSSFSNMGKMLRYKAKAAERADHVICVSESTRRDAIDILRIPPEKITVVHHGFALMGAKGGNSISASSQIINQPFLLYVGHRGGYKNFLRLLDAYASSAALVHSFDLISFGGGPLRADELEAIRRLGLQEGKVLQLTGGDELLSALYSKASAFIFPSLYEGFGIPPLEAMAHNCPVICSQTSSIPEVVGNAGEYFDPGDVESMRGAIERVMNSEVRRNALINNGRQRLTLFSWNRCAAETYDVYKKLLE
jgi:glycosyltransferase involved in cell wall biosynthesis